MGLWNSLVELGAAFAVVSIDRMTTDGLSVARNNIVDSMDPVYVCVALLTMFARHGVKKVCRTAPVLAH